MDKASVKLILRKTKAKKDGTAPIWIRITANRKSRYVATGIYIDPKHWNDRKQEVRASHDIAPALNTRLKEVYLQAQTQALDTPSAGAVKASMTGGGGSFTSHFAQFIEGLNTADRFWDWKKFRVTLGKLQAALGKEIDWKDLDRQAIATFERHLRETCGNGPNTVRKELGRVRLVIKQAIRRGIVKPEADPYLVYDRPRAKPVNRRKLTIEEVRAIEALDLDAGTSLCACRDAFVFSFYGGGIRFGDLCALKPEHTATGRLEYRMMKTGSMVSVPLPEPATRLAQRYASQGNPFLFPFLEAGDEKNAVRLRRRISVHNVTVNRDLKRIAGMAGIDETGLSFHVARHSFADFARRQSGDLYAVSKTLGHTSLQVTQQYLRSFDRDAVDRLATLLWDNKERSD